MFSFFAPKVVKVDKASQTGTELPETPKAHFQNDEPLRPCFKIQAPQETKDSEQAVVYIYTRSKFFDPQTLSEQNDAFDINAYFAKAASNLNFLSQRTVIEVFRTLPKAFNKNPTLYNNQDYIAEVFIPASALYKLLDKRWLLKEYTEIYLNKITRLFPVVFISHYNKKYETFIVNSQRNGFCNPLNETRKQTPKAESSSLSGMYATLVNSWRRWSVTYLLQRQAEPQHDNRLTRL